MRGRLTRLIAICGAAVLGACEADRGPSGPGPNAVSILEEAVNLSPGEQVALTLQGAAGGEVAWEVRDAAVVELPEEGVLRALAPGLTWAVARSSSGSDSVRVSVSFAGRAPGTIAFSIGAEDQPLRLAGVSRIHKMLVGGDAWTNITASLAPDPPSGLRLEDFFAGQDTIVTIRLQGEPEVGYRAFAPWELRDLGEGHYRIEGAEGAMVWIRQPGHEARAEIYVPVGDVELEIDESRVPLEVGPPTGALRGRVAFESAGLVVEFGEGRARIVGQVSTETTNVYAEFELAQRIEPIGRVSTTVTGGPQPTEQVVAWAPRAGLLGKGLLLSTAGRSSSEGAYSSQLWLGGPGVGDIELDVLTAEELMDRSALDENRAWMWTESATLADFEAQGYATNLGLSNGGTLTVTRYEAPGLDTWGRIEATVRTRQLLFYGGESGAEQMVELDIVAPIVPTSESVYPHQPSAILNREEPRVEPGTVRVSNGPLVLPGRVLETMTTALANVPVTLRWSGGTATVLTNEVGEFAFTGLHAGAVEVDFELPPGFGLARGQRKPVGPIELTTEHQLSLPVHLSDPEGNGAIRLGTGVSGTRRAVDGVEARIRAEGSSQVVLTLRSGSGHPAPGVAIGKLPPGRYEIELVAPAGYRLSDDQEKRVRAEVYEGRMFPVFAMVVES